MHKMSEYEYKFMFIFEFDFVLFCVVFASSVVLKIGNQIGALLLRIDTGEGHSGTNDVLGWVLEVGEEMLISPSEVLCLHGFGVGECSSTCSSSEESAVRLQNRSYPRVGAEAVRLSPSRAWQAAHWPSKMARPALGSPTGTSTFGSGLSFLGGGIRND